jgi:hypothetical protein
MQHSFKLSVIFSKHYPSREETVAVRRDANHGDNHGNQGIANQPEF